MWKNLLLALSLCATWTAWKVFAILVWPSASSWRLLLAHPEPAPLAYIILLGYLWTAWAARKLWKEYSEEITLQGIAIGLSLALPVLVAFYFLRRGVNTLEVLLTMATFSILGGIVEETLYRGLLYDKLLAVGLRARGAAIAQSLVFGLSHPWGWEPVAAATLLGLIAIALRQEKGIGASIAFHWLLNTATHV